MHLIVDGYAHNIELMTGKKVMAEWLVQVVQKAGMTPFGKPYIQGFPWPGSDDWTALTGFQPLMESGLSIHCWPEKSFVFIDLFSCNDFSYGRVIAFIVGSLDMWKYNHIILDRGVDSKTGKITPVTFRRN